MDFQWIFDHFDRQEEIPRPPFRSEPNIYTRTHPSVNYFPSSSSPFSKKKKKKKKALHSLPYFRQILPLIFFFNILNNYSVITRMREMSDLTCREYYYFILLKRIIPRCSVFIMSYLIQMQVCFIHLLIGGMRDVSKLYHSLRNWMGEYHSIIVIPDYHMISWIAHLSEVLTLKNKV